MNDVKDFERRMCVEWICAVLADPEVSKHQPDPRSDQMDAAAWAVLATLWATLAQHNRAVLPNIAGGAIQGLERSRAAEAAGLIRHPLLLSRVRAPAQPYSRARALAGALGVGALSTLIFLGGIVAVFAGIGILAG